MAYSLRIIRLLAVAAFVAPMAVAAQQSASTPPENDALAHPAQHLSAAGERLSSISGKVPSDAAAPLAALRKHFGELTSNYHAKGKEIGPPISQQDPSSSLAGDWKDNFSDVERDLAVLVGAGNAFAEDFPSTPKGIDSKTAAANGLGPAAGTTTTSSVSVASDGTTGTSPATTPNGATEVAGMPTPTGTTPTGTSAVAGTVTPTGSAGTITPAAPAGTGATPGAVATPGTSVTPGTPTPGGNTATAGTTNPTGNPGSAGAPPAPGTPEANRLQQATPTTGVRPSGGDITTGANILAAGKVSMIGKSDLSPTLREQLNQFRVELEQFYASTMTDGMSGRATP